MKDKEKQIEEKDKLYILNTILQEVKPLKLREKIYWRIVEFINRKLPEDSVVFTKEEHNLIDHNIKHLETVCNNLEKERNSLEEELSKYKERELYSQSLTEREWVTKTLLFDTVQTIVRNERNQTRKETAEKIYRELQGHGTTYVKKWIEKEFGVKIKE